VVDNLFQRNSNASLVIAVIGLAAFAAISVWQFYVFAVFSANGAVDLQGGTVHLWLAIGAAFIACLIGFFVFSRRLRYDKQNELHITSPGHPAGVGRTTKDS
jgi:hypothetical protein